MSNPRDLTFRLRMKGPSFNFEATLAYENQVKPP